VVLVAVAAVVVAQYFQLLFDAGILQRSGEMDARGAATACCGTSDPTLSPSKRWWSFLGSARKQAKAAFEALHRPLRDI